MTKKEIIRYWTKSAENDLRTMEHLFGSGDFAWSLFIGHLVIEKLIKAYYVKRVDINVPLIHDLLRLSEKANLELTEDH